ncbi:hypothetical protein FQR65_LT06142 [Abscondita terminalis]|nr:hypothetical protein FQR65_LT06142 [Abscondita terminalis]
MHKKLILEEHSSISLRMSGSERRGKQSKYTLPFPVTFRTLLKNHNGNQQLKLYSNFVKY